MTDGCVGLNPCARSCFAKFADGADHAFGHAELHGAAGIADGENAFALADGRSAGDTKFFGVRGACEKSKRD